MCITTKQGQTVFGGYVYKRTVCSIRHRGLLKAKAKNCHSTLFEKSFESEGNRVIFTSLFFLIFSLEKQRKNTMVIPDGSRKSFRVVQRKKQHNTTCLNLIYERTNKGRCLQGKLQHIVEAYVFKCCGNDSGLPASINSNKRALFLYRHPVLMNYASIPAEAVNK